MNETFVEVSSCWEDAENEGYDSKRLAIRIKWEEEASSDISRTLYIEAYIKDNKFEYGISGLTDEWMSVLRMLFGDEGVVSYIRKQFIMHYGTLKGALVPK